MEGKLIIIGFGLLLLFGTPIIYTVTMIAIDTFEVEHVVFSGTKHYRCSNSYVANVTIETNLKFMCKAEINRLR